MSGDKDEPLASDLDEDLFDFGEAMIAEDDADIDLDEIFAAFGELESAPAAVAAPIAPPIAGGPQAESAPSAATEPEDDLFGVEEMIGSGESALEEANELLGEMLAEPEIPPGRQETGSGAGRVVDAALSRPVLAILVATTLMNMALAGLTYKNAGDMRVELLEAGAEMEQTARDVRNSMNEQRLAVSESFMPITPLDPENHPVFETAEQEIASGEYADARRRLYSLLAVVDRLAPEERGEVEARAGFLLARSLRDEALTREHEEGR
ncbi:MAG: hypothetical protein O7B99_07020 [Planctomycetota bacterium]|nr:hypothetical protein [Planctomycetota bacterium]